MKKKRPKYHAVNRSTSVNKPKPRPSSEDKIEKSPGKQPKSQQAQKQLPFEQADNILLVGEGNLSFAKSLLNNHGCVALTATVFDSREECFQKYVQAEENVQVLKEAEDEGVAVIYGVDATKADRNSEVRRRKGEKGGFDCIIFNFPHVGGKSTDVNRQVRYNQEMLVKFFKSSLNLLTPGGNVVVTLFEGEPYTLWNIRDLGRHAGLKVDRSFEFDASVYEDYSHARTIGDIAGGGAWKGEDRKSRTYVFERVDGKFEVDQGDAKISSKRKRHDSSSDDE